GGLGAGKIQEGEGQQAVGGEAAVETFLGGRGLERQRGHLEPMGLVVLLEALRQAVDGPRRDGLVGGQAPGGRGGSRQRGRGKQEKGSGSHAPPDRDQTTRAAVNRRTSRAPACASARAQAEAVAPVVSTSSTSTTVRPATRP